MATPVETLLSCGITNTPPDVLTSAWMTGLPDEVHAKLAELELVQPREPFPTAPTLDGWVNSISFHKNIDVSASMGSGVD